ncbi:MAG: urease accessory protein UreF [Paracoccaceae bacterium]
MILEQPDISINPKTHKVMAWLSPSFPLGAFAYSHGLEFEISEGYVSTSKELYEWLKDILRFGSVWNDLVLFCNSYKTDVDSLNELSDIAKAFAQSKERYYETIEMGNAFSKIISSIEGVYLKGMPLPIIMGYIAKIENVSLSYILPLYAHSFISNLISVSIRLLPLGQTDAQKLLFSLFPIIDDVAKEALKSNIGDMRNKCVLADLASMKHETLKVRLFKS